MKKLIVSFLILAVSVLSTYHILTLWRGFHLYTAHPSREGLLRAIRFIPSHPNLFYRLGLSYQWNMEGPDLRESSHYLERAIERNPLEQSYWLSLAKVLNKGGGFKGLRPGHGEGCLRLSDKLYGKMDGGKPAHAAGGPG